MVTILSLTVIRVLHSTVVPRPCATFGLLQDVLVHMRSALRRGLQLLHHILELLQQLAQLERQVCGKCDSSWREAPLLHSKEMFRSSQVISGSKKEDVLKNDILKP